MVCTPPSPAARSSQVSGTIFFFFNDTATTEIYTLSLHDALPISENEKWIFRATKMNTSFGKLVGHSNIHTYAKYEIIRGKYHLKLAITSAIWLESHEPSYSIAHFEKTFLIDLHYSMFVGLYGY